MPPAKFKYSIRAAKVIKRIKLQNLQLIPYQPFTSYPPHAKYNRRNLSGSVRNARGKVQK